MEGYKCKVSEKKKGYKCLLSHFPAIRKDKERTKIRIVFDAVSKKH